MPANNLLRRPLAMVAAIAITIAAATVATPVFADTAPADPTQSASVSSDVLPTVQINGVVWSQAVVGNTVYVGGDFSNARPAGSAAGVNTVPRTNLLAYNLATGELITSFAPTLNGVVRAVAGSPDGTRVYVGGLFTTVNGVTRNRIAAFDTATGALITSFAPSPNYRVNAIVPTATTVYIGGSFSSLGSNSRPGAAAVSASNGAILPWAPVALGGGVNAMALSPDGSKIALGGAFTTLNGVSATTGYGLGMVSSTGTATTTLPFATNTVIRNAGVNGAITSMTSDADGVYGSGYDFGAGANFEGAFRASWADGATTWIEDCHGDTYSTFPTPGLVYIAGHPHHCGNVVNGFPEVTPRVNYRALAFTKTVEGVLLKNTVGSYTNFAGKPSPALVNWFPEFNVGTFTGQNQGPWHVTGNAQYVVYGGEFTSISGKSQQGLARFAVPSIAPNDDGPRVSGASFVPTSTASRAPGTVTLSFPANWDRDNEVLTYRVIRDGNTASPAGEFTATSSFYNRPALTFVDAGVSAGSHTYSLRAIDPHGNVQTGSTISATASSGTALTSYPIDVLDDNPRHYWRLGETSGTSSTDIVNGFTLSTKSGVTRNVTGSISGDSNKASRFNGSSSGYAGTTTSEAGPQIFSVEAWVKTASTAGGKIIGFGSASTGNSSTTDRHLYFDASGKINFGVYSGGNRTVTSPASYNNNQWHHVVGSFSAATGLELYVDGVLVAERTDVRSARVGSGYWRVGGDSTWNGNGYLNGDIDEPAVYFGALNASQVASHYSAGTGGGGTPTNQPPVASFTASTSGLSANVSAAGSSDPDGTIASYSWEFGDGATATGITAARTYAAAGTYVIRLTVVDNAGASATTTRSVTVSSVVTPPGVVATDTFARSSASGWGSADVGGAWTVTGSAANYTVASGVGAISAPAAGVEQVARLTSVSSTALDLLVTTTLNQQATGSSAYVSIIGRSVGSVDYRARLVLSTSGGLNVQALGSGVTLGAVATGLTYTPGEQVNLRFRVTGTSPTTLQVRAWKVGTTEPASWQLSLTDSTAALQAAGAVGLGLYLGGSSTGLPRVATFDNFTVTTAV